MNRWIRGAVSMTASKYQQFIDIGMLEHLIPIVASNGVISSDSTLNQDDAGKQPGKYDPSGMWFGLAGWSMGTTTFPDILLWDTWPTDLVGIRNRLYPAIDNDIDDPTIAQKVENVLQTFVPGTAKRTRVGSSRTMTFLKLKAGEVVQGKRRALLKNNLGAVELLWGGQQSVLCGTHPSGNMQTFTGEPLEVTAAQIDIIWNQIISVLGDLVDKVTKAGEAKTGDRTGGNVDYETTDADTVEQVRQYIASIPGAGEGERDDTAYKMVAHIRENFGVPDSVCTVYMPEWGNRCDPPFPMSEIRPRINSAYSGSAQSAQGSGNVNGVFKGPPVLHSDVLSEPVQPLTIQNVPAVQVHTPVEGINEVDIPISPDEWNPLHRTIKENNPYSTPYNFKYMLDRYGISIGYNLIKKDIIINGPGMTHDSDVSDNANLSIISGICELNKIKTGVINDNLYALMRKKEVNPVEEWIQSKAWDGTDRIDELFNTLTLAPEQDRNLAYMMFRKWLIGAVKIVQRKITSMENVLVLQEEAGGKGKTAWFKALCPEPWRKDGVRLDPSDKDTIKQAIGYWFVELGELDSIFRKSDIKHLMAFLGNSHDEIRLPYSKTYNRYARRTAFFGTVNKQEFLIDDSGDRRFWPISVNGVNYEHDIDMQQLWAQVDTLEERHWLNQEENEWIINANKDFKAVDPIDEMLENYFSGTAVETIQTDEAGNQVFSAASQPIMVPVPLIHLNCTELLQNAGYQFPTKVQLNKAGTWLRKNKYAARKVQGKAGYWVKAMVGRL